MKTLKTLVTLAFTSLLTASAFGQTTFNNGVLTVRTSDAEDVVSFVVGPLVGDVTLFNVPGIPDGTLFTGVTTLDVNTLGGKDQIRVSGGAIGLPIMRLNGGNQDDQIEVDLTSEATPNTTFSRITAIGGEGNDQFNLRASNFSTDFRPVWRVEGGEGSNETTATIDSQDPSANINMTLITNGGASFDKVGLEIIGQPNVMNLSTQGNLGLGDDEYVLNSTLAGNTAVNWRSLLNTGGGNDKFVANAYLFTRVNFTGVVESGEGNDVMEFYFEQDLRGTGVISSSGGDDTIKVVTDGTVLGSPRVNAGDGNDLVEFYASAVTGSPLSDGGPGIDQFFGAGARINFEN